MSSEILDVLNLQGGVPKKKQKTEQPKPKALTGINRELYQLLGTNTPPVAVRNQQKFKDRLNTLEKPSAWTWALFNNGARKDGLRLHHWVKGSREMVEASELPYKFEKYNTELNIPDFTESDYNAFIVDVEKEGEDVEMEEPEPETETAGPQVKTEETSAKATETANEPVAASDEPLKRHILWDYNETRYLFDLAKAFDLKWIVVHDRYNFEEDRERTLEDIQERFYSVCQRILIFENERDGDKAQNSNLISNLNFSKKKDLDRKAYLNRLLERSPAEIAEEESLLIEAKKFEATAKNTMLERAQLIQLLDSPQATGPINQFLSSQGLTQLYNQLMTEKRKRRVDSPAPENPLTALNEKIKQQHLARQKQLLHDKQEQQKKIKDSPISILLSKNLTPREEAAFGLKVHQERISPGVFLRSSKLSTFKPNVQQRMAGILNELGLGKKPVMATEKIVLKQDDLQRAINTLLDLKRQVDKLEAEAEMLK